jgi:hypothetical protein
MISFPASPDTNDTYTVGTRTWKWTGSVWQLQPRILSTADISDAGLALGAATLDASGKVPSTQLPSYVDDVIEAANFASLPETGETGKIYVLIDTRKTYRWSGSIYVEISASEVTSVNGYTGTVTLAKSDVGLGNVDNTSDADKPVSTAAQTALDAKQIKTVYSDTAPSHSAGLEWVDTTDLRSYRSYNSAWVEIDRA